MMSRRLTMVCLLSVFVLAFSGIGYGAILSIPNMSANPGAAIQIPVNVDDATGIAGYQFTIAYNASGTVLNCTGTVAGSLTSAAAGWVKSQNLTVANQVTVGGFQSDNIALTGGSGSLVQLTCTVTGSAGATTNVCFLAGAVNKVVDADGITIATGSGCGVVTVNQCDPTSYVPVSTICGEGVCANTGMTSCVSGQILDSCTPGQPTGADDNCNGIDENCNGTANENYVPTATNCGVGACAMTGQNICVAGQIQNTCTPGTPTAEVCNGIDDNCDGQVDNITPAACNTGVPGVCADGTTACVSGALVCQQNQQPTAEVCDGLDNNCDGTVDNITPVACTVPGQMGPCANGQTACQAGQQVCQQTYQPVPETPPGSGICQDGIDNDCDGTTDAADAGCQFAAESNCFDGIDNNGDGNIDCTDPTCANAQGPATTCGVGACAASGNLVCRGGVQVNTCTPGSPTAEICDGIDNNCDGQVDNGIDPVAITCGVGACQANGQRVCVGGQLVDQCTPGTPSAEVCDNIDNNCDGIIDNITPTPTTCGVGACANTGQQICQGGNIVDTCTPLPPGVEGPFGDPSCSDGFDNDCDDTTDAADLGCAQVCVPQAEVCDGIDNDCNGQVDDGIAPIDITCGVGACRNTGVRVCVNGSLQDQCTPLPAGTEGPFGDATCADQVDNDCDGFTDAADTNCAAVCVPTQEICDGKDNDCDGVIDNNITAMPTTCGVGACASTGEQICQNGQFVDTCVAGQPGTEAFGVGTTCSDNIDNDCDTLVDAADPGCAAPPVEQACFDGVDNDGDGLVDCADPDCVGAKDVTCDTGLAGSCAAGQVQCVPGNAVAQCVQIVFPQQEICNDGIDNDCDGLIDAADPNCQVGDVGLKKLIVPNNMAMKVGQRDRDRLINVQARVFSFDEDVMATVTLTAAPGAGVSVGINPASITKEMDEYGVTVFQVRADIACRQAGTLAINWTAKISSAQNSNPANDVATDTTKVVCR